MMQITIGSRGSALALTQTKWVAEKIQLHNPDIETRIEIIRTKGDKILDTPLAKIGDKGLFVKEIELALVDGRIDLAVHSMKDLPSEMTEGLVIGAVPARVDPSDVLLSNKGTLDELGQGARIGSSSLRRRAQLMAFRPDLEFHDLRGNLDTRIRRLQTGAFDAIVLAYAGLHRLNWDGEIAQRIPFDICLPAVGQGALAVQVRESDERMAGMVSPLDDAPTRAAVTAERALLGALGGGCQTPIAAVALPKGNNLVLSAMVASLDGKRVIRAEESGTITEAAALGERTAGILLDRGASEILEDVRSQSAPTDMGAA
ncbi:MAG: hydroxymethylbilane synthase [Armatimonadetes bacterium]|nr:hydroxymethylbilane synthase [Armatimonadota bacterium]